MQSTPLPAPARCQLALGLLDRLGGGEIASRAPGLGTRSERRSFGRGGGPGPASPTVGARLPGRSSGVMQSARPGNGN
jgi:hypothetical protein